MKGLAGFLTLFLVAVMMACGSGPAAPAAMEMPAGAMPTANIVLPTATVVLPAAQPAAGDATPPTSEPSSTPSSNSGKATLAPEPTPGRVVVETPAATPTAIPTVVPTPARVLAELPGQSWPLRVESVSVVSAGDVFALRVVSVLPHYCYRVSGHDVKIEGDKLLVDLTAVDDSETQAIACAQAEKEVVTDIPLPDGLRRGASYTVVVNGLVIAAVTVPGG